MIAEIDYKIDDIYHLCHHHKVESLDLFGSAVSENRFDPQNSDLDFLVKFHPSIIDGYADNYYRLWKSLEALFDRPVDLMTAGAVKNPYVQKSIDQTKVKLYES